jgi:hypothetical protein
MSDPRDYSLDISGLAPQGNEQRATDMTGAQSRPYLSVQFDCCGVYQRVYRDRDGQSYTARCPRCGKTARFAVGEGGTRSRCFVVK